MGSPRLPGWIQTSFIKWAGGKAAFYPELHKLMPKEFGRYLEPFLGGGSVFLNLSPKNALLNDKNTKLINTWRVIKDDVRELSNKLEEIERDYNALDVEGREAMYYRSRDTMNVGGLVGVELAAMFIFLNRTGYNGLYRENRKGFFNVPHGRQGKKADEASSYRHIFVGRGLDIAHVRLENAEIYNMEFSNFLTKAMADDFVYLDPPYHEKGSFVSYTNDSWGETELKRLGSALKRLNKIGAKFMLSHNDTPEARYLFKRYHIHEFMVPRAMGRRKAMQTEAKELVICNYTV